MPVDSFAGFGRLVAVPPLSSGGVSIDFHHHALRQLQRDRHVVDDLHVAAGQVVDDVAGGIADHVGIERVRGEVLVVEEHERVAVLVRIRGLAAAAVRLP